MPGCPMLFARQAVDGDEDAVVALARLACAESWPDLPFSAERTRATFREIATASPTRIFVAEDNREVIGVSLCYLVEAPFHDGLVVEQHAIFVRPDKRGTRAAAELVQAFKLWIERLRPLRAIVTLGSGRRADASARFMRRAGFRIVGHVLERRT